MEVLSQEPMEKESPKEKEVAEDDQTGLSSASSSPVAADLKQPEKKPTRQWAAWTRQEEENFFNALRQVGKNFEKITSRVQSKNKDQVRHYYYRLVRRMKKLLGPGFGLDAKNSKDTIAAMLRWWSLLEKYSCAASKLHLKPRRFKTFIEALAHQLLKDRNKTRRKQSNHEEAYSFTPPSSSSMTTKGPGSDIDPVKLLFLDSQKNHKLAYPKKSSLRANTSVDINCSKGGFSIVKSMKHNRRTGLVASAAYKRWERAALAGVSLVADAAEQLERTTNDMVCSSNQATISNQPLNDRVQEDNAGSTANPVPCSPSGGTHSHLGQSFVQAFTKLKLQLFPVDEFTRTELEKDNHNPYLELTLSGKKRMSSILEHLNCKWGKSSIALRELALLPYDVQMEGLINCQKWTVRDRTACAADVYQIVGRPEVFRLRYGWLSNSVPGLRNFQFTEDVVGKISPAEQAKPNNVPENLSPIVDNGIPSSNAKIVTDGQAKSTNLQDILSPIVGVVPSSNATADVAVISMKPNFIYQETLQPTTTSCLQQAEETKSEKKQGHNEDNVLLNNLSTFSASEWADSLTNISVGDLLSEASRAADYSNDHRPCIVSCPPVKSTLSCDSFDAAVAAHLFNYKNQQSTPNRVSQASLWDAEETCDEFSFKKISLKMSSKNQEDLNGSYKVPDKPCNQTNYSDTVGFSGLLKDADQTEPDDTCERGMMVDSDCTEIVSQETFDTQNAFALADIYWPDSLGTFDLGIPSFPRYSNQDLTFGDSLSQNGLLNRLIDNSADAFQNLSFSGSEKRAQSARDGEEAMSHSSQVKSE